MDFSYLHKLVFDLSRAFLRSTNLLQNYSIDIIKLWMDTFVISIHHESYDTNILD